MILVTVGSELPFDRLVKVVDDWARERGRKDVFAQVAESEWRPSFIEYKPFLEPKEFAQRLTSASVIISHAGMGTILSALRYEKPILVMPRRTAFREVRNEHQLATAQRLAAMGRIAVALDEKELRERLDRLDELKPKEKISPYAGPELIEALKAFIAN